MNNVLELEKQLNEAKVAEKLKYLQGELDIVKKEYEGKAFGSHTFERHSSAANLGAIYYERFFIEEDKIYVIEHSFGISKHDAYYKPSKTDIGYRRSINKRCLTDGKHNASYLLYSGYSHYRKEISVAAFKKMWEGTEEVYETIKSLMSTNVDKQELIRMGDSNNEDEISLCIRDMGLEFIDLKNYPKVHSALEYKRIPMFDRNRWLPKQYAKPIIQWVIKQNNIRRKDNWTTTRVENALKYENEVLTDFILTL